MLEWLLNVKERFIHNLRDGVCFHGDQLVDIGRCFSVPLCW